MRINNISYTNTSYSFGAKHRKTTEVRPAEKSFQNGLNTAGAWFGFGVGLDFVTRRLSFFKSPLKNSIAINGLIGTAAGVVTCVRAGINKKSDI